MHAALQGLLGVFLPLSFLGYFLFVRKTLLLRWEFIPVFVFSSIACIVYFFGLAGQLLAGSLAVLFAGLFALFFVFASGFRAKDLLPRSFSLFQVFFWAGSTLFFFLLLQSRLTHYDNFSHWGIVLKQMLSANAFPTAASKLVEFKNYPLGVSSFLYYVCRFGGRSQSMMLFAQGMLVFSCFYAMFGIISEKKRFFLYAFLGLGCSILSFFNITIRINNLLVDFLLPIYTLAIFAVVYQYRSDIKRACVTVLPLAGLLTVVKSTGIIFAGFGLLFLIFIWARRRERPLWKSGLFALGTAIGSFLPYFGWSFRMATLFQGIENKFDVSVTGLQMEKSSEQMHEIISLFLKASADLSTRPAMGIVIFQLAALAACIFAAIKFKKKWNLWKALIALDFVLILYYAGILALYLYSMPLEEAIDLAGFERYASSIVTLFAGGLLLCATADIENSFYYKIGEVEYSRAFKSIKSKSRYQKGTLACTMIAATLLMSEYNGILSIERAYDETIPAKIYAVTGDRWVPGGGEDESRYLFYASDTDGQVTNYYMQYVARYFLCAPNVDGVYLFHEDDLNDLLGRYDYLVIAESDHNERYLLNKHYGVSGWEGVYQIDRAGDSIRLLPS